MTVETFESAKEKVDEFINRPDVQEKIEGAKEKTVDFAEKAVDKLKDWLKPKTKEEEK